MSTTPCTGCAHAQPRFRLSRPVLHCLRFHMPAMERCLDYRTKPSPLAVLRDLIRPK
jgi:hypothetical protein